MESAGNLNPRAITLNRRNRGRGGKLLLQGGHMKKTKLYNTKERRILGTISGHLEQFVKLDNCVVVEFDSGMDIEAALRNYYYMQKEREKTIRKLESELNRRTAIQAANGGIPHSGTDPVGRRVELLLQQDALINKLKADKWRLENDILVCEILLDQLTPEERRIIDYYYIQGKYWREVAGIMRCSRRGCIRKRKRAIEKMKEFTK
jgi:RNA polymerase sigma factor (sigma-70 family)